MNLGERTRLVVQEIGKDIKGLKGRVTALEGKPSSTVDDSQVEQIATRIVQSEVAKVVDGAPEAYNTLKEVASYIESDKSGASAMAESINKRLRFDEVQSLNETEKANVIQSLGLNDSTDLVAEYKNVVNG